MEGNEKARADVALVKRGLAPSRERAQALIDARLVSLNGKLLEKPSVKVGVSDALAVSGMDHPYVSRGGLKLEKALREFGVSVEGITAMDIGASTGGFTDVLLQSGAARVYAIDVGTAQLDPKLSADPRVISMERTNARTLNAAMFPVHPTLAVMDVSFISIELILPALFEVLGRTGCVISLIKPQFEAGREHLGKKGIVSDPRAHEAVLVKLVDGLPRFGWQVRALTFSPIQGSAGNIEYLGDFVPGGAGGQPPNRKDIALLVKAAFQAARQ